MLTSKELMKIIDCKTKIEDQLVRKLDMNNKI